MKKILGTTVALLALVASAGVGWRGLEKSAAAKERKSSIRKIPSFQVDPSWPKVPNGWAFGQVSDIRVDAQDHVWFIHRVRTVKPELKDHAAPPVLEFDTAGNFIKAWGGPGEGYEWPGTEHSMYIDYKGNFWIAGECNNCFQLLKFDKNGKFLMQMGHAGQRGTMVDTANFVGPKDTAVYPKTNELFVGDTGGHGRIMVFDADTGAFKRMWGAFGNAPIVPGPDEHGQGGKFAGADVDDGGNPPQLQEAHCMRVSNDGLVYACDGPNKRIQVYTVDGKFVAQKYINVGPHPKSTATGTIVDKPAAAVIDDLNDHHETSSMLAFSTDPKQQFLYVLDRSRQKILILDRKTLDILGDFGDGPGRAPGQLYILHSIAVDSHGNVYTSEVNDNGNRRAQKFVFKGMVPVSAPAASTTVSSNLAK